MKIRWTQASVRLRITPTEMEALIRGEPVRETLALPSGDGWTAVISPGAPATALAVEQGVLHLDLSDSDRQRLAAPEAEGVYFRTDGDPPVRYFIQKDFPCAHPRSGVTGEKPTETFETPPGRQPHEDEEKQRMNEETDRS